MPFSLIHNPARSSDSAQCLGKGRAPGPVHAGSIRLPEKSLIFPAHLPSLTDLPAANDSTDFNHDLAGRQSIVTDSPGNITDSYDYSAYGNLIDRSGTTANDYLFTGEQFDSESGDYYLRARYYDPSVGRFTQMDTFPGWENDPITLNKYAYGNMDPVNNIDPSGNFSIAQQMVAVTTVGVLASLARPKTGISLATSPSGSDVRRGAAILFSSLACSAVKKLFCGLFFNGDSDACDDLCDEQLEIDVSTCNGISRIRGKSAAARCFKSASDRYAACLAGRPLPPLDTWNN